MNIFDLVFRRGLQDYMIHCHTVYLEPINSSFFVKSKLILDSLNQLGHITGS